MKVTHSKMLTTRRRKHAAARHAAKVAKREKKLRKQASEKAPTKRAQAGAN